MLKLQSIKEAKSGFITSTTSSSLRICKAAQEGGEAANQVKGIVSPEMSVIKIIQIRMTSHGPPSLPKPSYIRSQNRPSQAQQLGTSFQGMSSSAMIAPTVSERKVTEEYMKRMGMKNLGNMKHFSSKFKNAIAAPYFIAEDSGTPLASRMSRPYTRGPQNSSLGPNEDSRFRQTASNSSQPPPRQERSFHTHDLNEIYRGRPRDVAQPSIDQNLSSRPLTSQVERHSHSRQSKSPGMKPFEVPSHSKKKMTPAQQLGIVEIELKKARGEYYQGLRQLLKMESDFQNKFSLRAHLLNIKRICQGGLELGDIQARLGSFDDTLTGLERLTQNLFTSKRNSVNIDSKREAPSRTTSLKISEIVQENKNLKFTHFSQTKCFLHIQKVDDALLFYIYHKYASKPVLAKSEMTEDKLELEELVGSLMLVATQSGAVTVRRAEDQWDTRLKSSNPYVNRLQNNILMYSPSVSDSIHFGKPVFVPPIYNFYLEKRDHQHNLRIKYINGKTKEESPELPTYFLDPEVHIPKSVLNCARHVRKFIKRKIRVKHRNSEPYVELLQNQDDQSHLVRFQIHYAPQILDNFQDIKTQHNLSLVLEGKHSAQMKAKEEEDDDQLVKPQLQSLISKILRANQMNFLSPGCLLLIEGSYIFAQLVVDQLNNEGWLFLLVPKANDVGILMKQEIEQIMQQESGLRKIQIYPSQTQVLSAPLLLIANRWQSIHDLKANPTTFLRSLQTRQLLQQLLSGEGYQ